MLGPEDSTSWACAAGACHGPRTTLASRSTTAGHARRGASLRVRPMLVLTCHLPRSSRARRARGGTYRVLVKLRTLVKGHTSLQNSSPASKFPAKQPLLTEVRSDDAVADG